MGDTSPAETRLDDRFDWASTRRVVRLWILGHRAGYRLSDADIEDLCHEALVKLMRFVRKAEPDNLEATATEIAKRTVIDHWRSRRRWQLIVEPLADGSPEAAAPFRAAAELGDPLQRVRWIVLSYFDAANAPCAELARAYFEELNWESVAQRTGRAATAVRKQWSRCVESLRAAVQRSPVADELLGAWAAGN